MWLGIFITFFCARRSNSSAYVSISSNRHNVCSPLPSRSLPQLSLTVNGYFGSFDFFRRGGNRKISSAHFAELMHLCLLLKSSCTCVISRDPSKTKQDFGFFPASRMLFAVRTMPAFRDLSKQRADGRRTDCRKNFCLKCNNMLHCFCAAAPPWVEGHSHMISAEFVGFQPPTLVTVTLTQPISTVVAF